MAPSTSPFTASFELATVGASHDRRRMLSIRTPARLLTRAHAVAFFPMAPPTRARLLFVAKLAFSALLLWIVCRRLDTHGIAARLRVANWHWLVLGLSASPIVIALAARRWQVLSQGLLSFGDAFRYSWIGLFFGSIIPGMVSGDVAKGVALAAKSAHARDERLPVSIFFDKLIGLWVLLVLFCIVALMLLAEYPQTIAGLHGLIVVGFAATFIGLAAGAGIMHSKGSRVARRLIPSVPGARLRTFAERVLADVGHYAAQPRLVGEALLLSVAIHGINSLAFWLALRSLAIPASLFFAAVMYPMLSLLLAAPISISGIGVRDIFLFALFRTFGLNPDSGVAFSWLLLGLGLLPASVGGLIQLWEIFRRRRA